MITSDRASLSIFSATHPASAVSAALGLKPTQVYERGDRFGRGLTRPTSGWILHAPEDPDSDTQLDVLVRMLRGRAPALATLREHYDTQIGYTGFSDSENGSFALSAETISALAELGCGLLGTVILEPSEPLEPSDPL